MKKPTPKSERLGDSTPAQRGHHGTSKGRKDHMASDVNQTPAILDRDPAKGVKPWADAPAAHTRGWIPAHDGSGHPAPESGALNHSAPEQGNQGRAGWKSKNYSLAGPAVLPEGELKKKWSK